jgi:putative methyltransferase (TIGR04325 family)
MAIKSTFRIWEGVYEAWADAPRLGDAFDDQKWLEDQEMRARAVFADLAIGGIPQSAISRDYVLPMIAAMAMQDCHRLRILDFGGGMAVSYPSVIGAVPNGDSIEFHVVESAGICERGRVVIPERFGVVFHSKIPSPNIKYDIVNASRSVHYVDDWQGLMQAFALWHPRYIVLAGLLAGDNCSFVSIQNYYDYRIPVRFLNRNDVINVLNGLGYRLIYNTLHVSKRLDKEGTLPMDNFPEENRLEYPCQLVFSREIP